ncbi:MAG: four helix bundle protein [Persicimonas sp.]
MLDFQKLDVYRCASALAAITVDVIAEMPRGYAKLADQLNRASTSMVLNIAEGCGKTSARDKKNYFAIARGSAMECAAMFDVLEQRDLVTGDEYDEALELAERTVAMLTKMCR